MVHRFQIETPDGEPSRPIELGLATTDSARQSAADSKLVNE
jgi:hypothetical protein